jgi:hypothetical protein
MTAPDRIKMAHNGGLPTGNYPESEKVEYIRRDPAVLAADPMVQAMIGAVVEEAAQKQEARYTYWVGQLEVARSKASVSAGQGRAAGHYTAAEDIRALHPDATAALSRALQQARNDALDEVEALRDVIADEIGAKPMSSIHSALSEYRNRIRALKGPHP